jgi:hypothetical protein
MTTTTRHYENDNGMICCEKHAGVYLTEALAQNPNAEVIDTPADTWYLMHPAEVQDFAHTYGTPCETCRFDG